MDIYYFYNGANNIINLLSKNEQQYTNGDLLIYRDPLVILDLYDKTYIKSYINLNGGSINSNENSNKETNFIIKVLNLIKFLIKIIIFLATAFLLPIMPFYYLSYYSFLKLKIYFDTKIKTL